MLPWAMQNWGLIATFFLLFLEFAKVGCCGVLAGGLEQVMDHWFMWMLVDYPLDYKGFLGLKNKFKIL